MSTSFNNQWILDRTAHGRGAAYTPAEEAEGDAGEEPDALVSRETLPDRRPPRPRTARTDGLAKRPKWVDRDT